MKVYVHVGSWNWWIHEWFQEPSQKDDRAHEKSISCSENGGSGALLYNIALVWVATWANPADAPSRNRPIEDGYASLPKPSAFASVHAFVELHLLREPLSAATRTAGEHVRTLESLGSSTAREQVLLVVKTNPTSEEDSLRLQTSGDGLLGALRPFGAKKERRIKKMEGSSCLWDRDQITGEKRCCIVQAISKDILVRNARSFCEVNTCWKTFCPPLRHVKMWPLQSSKNICESETSMGSKSSSIMVSTNWVISAPTYLRTCSASGTLGQGQAGTRRLLAKSCGADLEHHQSVFRTLWRVHRSWSLAIQAEFRTPASHEIVLSVAVSAPECLRAFFFDALFVSLFVRQLRWCDVKMFLMDQCQHVAEKFDREPKTRRMTGHAAQQHVLLECPGICQLVNTMKSSILDHKLDTPIWRFTATQHFDFFQRQRHILCVSHQALHAPRTRRRWSYRTLASVS